MAVGIPLLYMSRARLVTSATGGLLMKPAHSTKDLPLCLPQNRITPTAAHYAGTLVWLSPSYILLSSPSEELDCHADMP